MQVAVAIGKYTLESLTAGMYSSPKDLYREYIQNSVDAIDQAIAAGVLDHKQSKIKIHIDKQNRRIEIEDNGLGIPTDNTVKKLTDIGNSSKAYSVNRGFRGIGRLAGLSYCERLTFITSCKGEAKKTSLSFDCVRLKELLIPGQYNEYDLSAVISEVTTVKYAQESANKHYFKVTMEGVEDIDGILNSEEMEDYLSQVAPLPFNPDTFEWGKEIKDKFKIKGIEIGEYNIFTVSGDKEKQLYKVNSDRFLTDKLRRVMDEIRDIEVVEILDENGNAQAILWYAVSNFYGTILDESKKGLRIRKGNILIGDKSTLNSIFKEDRFNGWFQGEVYVLDGNIIPNARRDNFEKNEAYFQMFSKLINVGDKLSRTIRSVSNSRNDRNSKVLNEAEILINKADKLLEEGFNSQKEKEEIEKELNKYTDEVKKVEAKNEVSSTRKVDIFKQLSLLTNNIKGATNFKILNLSQKLTIEQKKILEKVFETLTEQCDKKEADRIISEIMKKF